MSQYAISLVSKSNYDGEVIVRTNLIVAGTAEEALGKAIMSTYQGQTSCMNLIAYDIAMDAWDEYESEARSHYVMCGHKKIRTIKHIRELSKQRHGKVIGLKDAKMIVDRIEQEINKTEEEPNDSK